MNLRICEKHSAPSSNKNERVFDSFNPSRPDPGQIFVFTLLCGASKGFMKAFREESSGWVLPIKALM